MAAQSVFRRRGDDTVSNSLDIARDTFTWLVTGPHPVSLNGRLFPGLPDRRIPLDEVRDRLLARRCPQATRDAVWAHLVLRSRTEGATWTVAAVGVALPALTSAAATLSRRFAGDPADVHAEVLRGFLTALSTIDLRPPRIMLRLRWAAPKTRKRAERRLAEYLREGVATADRADPLIDQVAAAVALARPVTPARETPQLSPSVSDTNGESERKVRRRVSKTDADSGVQ